MLVALYELIGNLYFLKTRLDVNRLLPMIGFQV